MIKKLLFIFISLFLFFACKKQVEKERPEFIGIWYADIPNTDGYFVRLTIDSNSNADYFIYWDHDNHYYGTARASDNHLKIGRFKFFKIVEYPHKIDTTIEKVLVYDDNTYVKLANWKMILEGMKPGWLYADGTFTYYKADY
jgi:hypothetical protein